MNPKKWFCICITGVLLLLSACGILTFWLDPFFHYRKPRTEQFFYVLDNERSQNDGIAKHFAFDAVITGTSMTENFKTSELDELFGVESVKLPARGGSYQEINDILRTVFEHRDNVKLVVRGLDVGRFFDQPDLMRDDLGIYPVYLYNQNPFDDVRYLLNRGVIFRCYQILRGKWKGEAPGITSFDDYGDWTAFYEGQYGKEHVLAGIPSFTPPGDALHLTEEERQTITENIQKNVVNLCKEHPETTFYLFFTPYSAAWWGLQWQGSQLEHWIEAEELIIQLLLPYENIKLFSFHCETDITTDLNNYKDVEHYGYWINSRILQEMKAEQGLITKENYKAYQEQERTFYSTFDYNSLFQQ